MKHPWFSSTPPNESISRLQSPLETDQFQEMYPEDYQFDDELLCSLRLLGWKDKNLLLQELKAKGKNIEKVYYRLLEKRKWEILENYHPELHEKYHDSGTIIRRTDSFGNEGGKPDLSTRSTRRSISEGGAKLTAPSRLSPQVSTEPPVSEKGPPNSTSSPKLIKTTVTKKNRKPLLIKTNDIAAKSDTVPDDGSRSPITKAMAAIGLGTPKFHRKAQLLSSGIDVPQSPIISQHPKTSWFQNFFNFKPEVMYIHTTKSLAESVKLIETILLVFSFFYVAIENTISSWCSRNDSMQI
jgi:hypothetical protein